MAERIKSLKYYVYAYLSESTKLPYYIGKGSGRRSHSKNHRVAVPKNADNIVFLETGLSEIGALALERRYIAWYGRRIDNSGILLNIDPGGKNPPAGKFERKAYDLKAMSNKVKSTQFDAYGDWAFNTPESRVKRDNALLKKFGTSNFSEAGKIAYREKTGLSNPREAKATCPHCGKIGHAVAFKRWHMDNCKQRHVFTSV